MLKLFMNGQQIRCFCSWCDVLLMFSWPFHEVGFCCININSLFNRVEIADRFQVALVLSNKRDAGVLERARRLNVPAFVFTGEEFDAGEPIIYKLAEYPIDFIVLAGFLRKIPDKLLRAFPNRIVNIHPALLPKYGGKGMYGRHVHEAVVRAGEHESGITIHYIDDHYDEGAIIFQASCPLSPSDTPDDVARKVHALEYAHYPRVIEQVLQSI